MAKVVQASYGDAANLERNLKFFPPCENTQKSALQGGATKRFQKMGSAPASHVSLTIGPGKGRRVS